MIARTSRGLFAAVVAALALAVTIARAQPVLGEGITFEPYSSEVWVHALRQSPTEGEPAFGVTLEGVYLFGVRAHDRWRRNAAAEVLSSPMSWVRIEAGYDPESALITGVGGFHAFAEGSFAFAERIGAGAYARYDRAGSPDAAVTTDLEVGAQFSFWSDERRSFFNGKLGFRRITADDGTQVDAGSFLQAREHLVYVPSEGWGLTFIQEGTVRIGIGSGPHTNVLRVENVFLSSPTLLYSIGPIVGVNLEYFVGPATSTVSVPVGGRLEVHPGFAVFGVTALYDVATMQGQRTPGLLVRGSVGVRF